MCYSFEDLLGHMTHYANAHPSQRRGQAYFNSLSERSSDLAAQICGTEVDPFYDDKKINQFLAAVAVAVFS
jgi:hypothetical protein